MGEPTEAWAAIISTFLLSVLGLCGYILFIYLITRNNHQRFSNPFYSMLLSSVVPQMYLVCQGLLVSLPVLTSELRFGPNGDSLPKWYRTVFGFFSTVAWLATLSHMLALAMNRLIAVYCPVKYKRLYTHTGCAAILLTCYFHAVFMSTLLLFGGCRAEYVRYKWRLVQSDGPILIPFNATYSLSVSRCSEMVQKMYRVTSISLIVLTAAICLCAVLGARIYERKMSTRFRGRNASAKEQCWSLTDQFAVTVGLLFVSMSTDWISSTVASDDTVSTNVGVSIFVSSMTTCSSALTPYVYIFLGAMVRTRVFGSHKCASNRAEIITGSHVNRHSTGLAHSAC